MMLQSGLETFRRLGVVRLVPNQHPMVPVRCCTEVIQHHTGDDAVSNILTLVTQSFRVV